MLDLWNWAVADPLLMGFAPWHYGDEPSYGTVMGVGMRDMPETLSVYTELGMRMRQHLGAQFKSDDGYPISATFQLLTCDAQRGRQLFNLSNPDGWLAFRTGCAACDPDAGNCIDCMGCQVGAIPHIWYCPAAGSGPGAASWKRNHGANCSGGACPAGAMQLQTTQSASCFGAGDLTYGATVFLQKCNGSDTRQLWSYDSSTGLVSSFGNSSFCLDGGTPLNVSCASAPLSAKPYCDTTLAPAARAKDLVSRMAPYEKVQNMVSSNPGVKRLGVPPFAFSEALHGVASGCAATAYFPELHSNNTGCPTSFPHALALGEPSAFFGLGRPKPSFGKVENQALGGSSHFQRQPVAPNWGGDLHRGEVAEQSGGRGWPCDHGRGAVDARHKPVPRSPLGPRAGSSGRGSDSQRPLRDELCARRAGGCGAPRPAQGGLDRQTLHGL